jgi:hypothetical protein
MDGGFFGDLFDFNHDGELDPMERAMDFMAFEEMTSEDDDDEDDLDDIELAGLDYDELSMMDEDERREALEDAGLDPDEYDFD